MRSSAHTDGARPGLVYLLAIVAAGALIVTGCGDDDSSEPAAEQPAAEQPAAEEPAAEEPAAEAPTAEEPAAEEPAAEEPTAEEPAAEEPAAEEPAAEEPAAEEPAAEEPLQVLFLYSGTANDNGWTEAFDTARQDLEAIFGDRIETTFKESLWGAELIAQVIDTGILDGADVIVGTSFEQGEPMLAAAAENPDVYFIASQWDNPGGLDNFAGYVNAPEDGAYIQGVIAGHMIGEGETVGWVDAFAIPYDIRTMNGFAIGLAHSNPTARVNSVFTNDWVDQNLAGQAARSLATSGVSFLTGIFSPTVGDVAESSEIPFAGVQLDASQFAPQMTVTTSEYTWSPMLERYLNSIFDGSFDTSFAYQGMSDGVITLTDWGPLYDNLSDDAKADVAAEIERISSAPLSVFVGPLVDINGNLVVAEGESLDVGALRSMAWVMPNVDGLDL